MNKVTLFLAVVLALPATALAQTAPQPPASSALATPASAPQPMHHGMSDADRQAMMAKMQASMAKVEAAHKAVRAKILASLTAAHKVYFANLVGQLAVATNPDWKAATAKLNATLSATEKSKILAIHVAAMKQMETMMSPMGDGNMRYKRVVIVKHADGTTSTSTTEDTGSGPAPGPPNSQPMCEDQEEMHANMMAPGAGMARMHGEMHMKHMKHALTAGDILMHLAGPAGPGGMPMMMRVERFGHGDMPWKRPAPVAAPTSTP